MTSTLPFRALLSRLVLAAWVPVLLANCLGNAAVAQDEAIAEAVAESKPSDTKNLQEAGQLLPQTEKSDEVASIPKARPITVSISLIDDATTLTGTLTETTSLTIKTAFGIADLPLNEVAGVKFPRGDDTATTVVMLNGDSITGATDLKFAAIETNWGSAKVNGQSIASMMMVPGLSWQAVDVLGGKRWQLIESSRGGSTTLGGPLQGSPAAGNQSLGRSPLLPAPGLSNSGTAVVRPSLAPATPNSTSLPSSMTPARPSNSINSSPLPTRIGN